MNEKSGNLEQVRDALQGITGIVAKPQARGPDWYLVMARVNRELDTVDSFRRNAVSCWWPNYEELVIINRTENGRKVRRLRRVGIIPGYVFSNAQACGDVTSLLRDIVGAIDVAKTFSGVPLLISDADAQIISRIEIGLNTPRPEKTIHNFKKGEKVSFRDDLVGRWPPGKIIKLAPDGRISVEIDLMGRKVPVTVLPHQIERM